MLLNSLNQIISMTNIKLLMLIAFQDINIVHEQKLVLKRCGVNPPPTVPPGVPKKCFYFGGLGLLPYGTSRRCNWAWSLSLLKGQ